MIEWLVTRRGINMAWTYSSRTRYEVLSCSIWIINQKDILRFEVGMNEFEIMKDWSKLKVRKKSRAVGSTHKLHFLIAALRTPGCVFSGRAGSCFPLRNHRHTFQGALIQGIYGCDGQTIQGGGYICWKGAYKNVREKMTRAALTEGCSGLSPWAFVRLGPQFG